MSELQDDRKLQEACWNWITGETSKEEDELISNAPYEKILHFAKFPAVADRDKAFEDWLLRGFVKAMMANFCKWKFNDLFPEKPLRIDGGETL